ALISIITTFDKGYTLYKRLWLHSLLGLLAAATVLDLALRPAPHLESSTIGVLCTLPLVFAYTWFNAYRGARHMHAINHQNWQLDELRRLDTQTGLQAREHWQDRAATVLQTFHTRSQPAYLMLIDIDHFKTINDTCGHTVGDEVISAVGKVILASVRHEDNAGRYGGDEFAVVAEADIAVAQSIGEAIRAQIEQLRFASAPQLRLTSSIGLAMAQPRHADLRNWINAADAALYRAKHLGRNQVAEVGR
ncbi:MAG: GGDEF domain-containing protein, partial [Thiomonas sp.]